MPVARLVAPTGLHERTPTSTRALPWASMCCAGGARETCNLSSSPHTRLSREFEKKAGLCYNYASDT